MDILNFPGLPDWARWVAQDEDGAWWAYEAEPNQQHNGWYENEVGRIQRLRQDAPNPDWQESLKETLMNSSFRTQRSEAPG